MRLGICLALALCAACCWARKYELAAGSIELRLTETQVESVLVRDRYALGDPREYRGPAIAPGLLGAKWGSVVSAENAQPPQIIEQTGERATVRLEGEYRGNEGGRWVWTLDLSILASRRLAIDYRIRQTEAPPKPPAYHRLSFTYPFAQALGPGRRPEHVKDPGRPVTTVDRAGKPQTVPFGGQPNIIAQPGTLELPWDDQKMRFALSDNVSRVEYWNGGWAQRINLSLPRPEGEVAARVEIDLSEIAPEPVLPVSLREVEDPLARWRDHPPETLPPPKEVLRLVQSLPAYSDKTDEEMDRWCEDLAKHFDIVQVHWAYWAWGYLQAEEDPKMREYLDSKIELVHRWLDACHRAGLKPALSVNWSPPVASKNDLKHTPELQGERFDPEAGKFSPAEGQFDWGDPAKAQLAFDALRDIASRLKGVSYQWFDEPCYRLHTWFEAPFFSEGALADFREFVGDPQARLPAKPYAADTPRTNNRATPERWDEWYRWVQSVYTRMIRGWVEAMAEASRDNPEYGGSIWFQASSWWGRQYGIDLDQVFALPGITWVVCEYCTNADDPSFKAFRHYAIQHGKNLSTFVNAGHYDATQPGSVRYEGTLEGYRRAVEFCFDQNASGITAYPSWSFLAEHEAFHEDRVRIWDEVTATIDER